MYHVSDVLSAQSQDSQSRSASQDLLNRFRQGHWNVVIALGMNQFTINPAGSQDLGLPQDSPEKSSSFKPVAKASKVLRIAPIAIKKNQERAVES